MRWIVGAENADAVSGDGVEVVVAGMPVGERHAEVARRAPQAQALPEEQRRVLAFSTLFAELAAPSVLPVLLPYAIEWRPDLLVHDAAELAGPVAAAAIGIPSVCHGFGELVPEAAVRQAGAVMAPHWRDAGLEPDEYAGSYRGLYVDIYPASLRAEDMAHVPGARQCRPADGARTTGDLVYVTFGTQLDADDEGLRAAVRAAADTTREVLVTVGSHADPDVLGPVPPNVTVERFVTQGEVLPRCAAVVCHGGSGTVLAALAHGVPVVCTPRGADQFANATNLERVGAGVSLLGPAGTDGDALRAALDQVLEEPGPRAAAEVLGLEISAMPSPEETAAIIEAWVDDR